MKIVGFNLARTGYGLTLDNGGACLIVDGKVQILINEERLTRLQYQAGFAKSIEYILTNSNLSSGDIDLFVASSCLEVMQSPEDVQQQLAEYGFEVPLERIRVSDHHTSHAYSAFYPSPFEKSVVMVMDGDGNVLADEMAEGTQSAEAYWHNKTEHNSYYLGEGNELTLIERDEVEAGENGFGGAYRYFTYFCGFPGYKYAGKLMGLAAYGAERNRYNDVHVFKLLENGGVKCLLPDTDRLNSAQAVEDWLATQGVSVKARKPHQPVNEDTEDIAWLIQRELNEALLHKAKYLIKKTGIKNLCIAGGVGLNAVSNKFLLDFAGLEGLYIQPAASDGGQCLGDAYFGLHQFDTAHLKREALPVYLGKEYTDTEILTALETSHLMFQKLDFAELTKKAAQKIADGAIVAWFQGGSEIGPRALGNRSIVADPRKPEMKDILNEKVKHRESFRPFAPSVLADDAQDWFDLNVAAPYMILNARVKRPEKIPAATHADGSARIQTVSKEDNARYYALILAFKELTGVPVLLNTSFNDNEAIVETPQDAINTFLKTGVDVLCLGDYWVEKS
jgi:carbamoyltransferase